MSETTNYYEFRTRVSAAALRLVQAQIYAELHPKDSTAHDSVEYAADDFDTHVIGFAEVLNRKTHTND